MGYIVITDKNGMEQAYDVHPEIIKYIKGGIMRTRQEYNQEIKKLKTRIKFFENIVKEREEYITKKEVELNELRKHSLLEVSVTPPVLLDAISPGELHQFTKGKISTRKRTRKTKSSISKR